MLRRSPLAAGALLLGAALVAVGVAGPPVLSAFDHLLLILAGIVLLPIGLVGLLRRPPAPPPLPPAAPLRPPAPTPAAMPAAAADPDPPAPGGPRTIADARMDRWGAVVGEGSLRFPADPSGRFRPSPRTSVLLVAGDSGAVTFVACRAERDPITGYLVAQEDGQTLTLVGPAATAVTRSLRFPPKAPTSFALDSTARLGRADAEKQPLSDLVMRIAPDGGGLHVSISARLHSAPWNRPGSMEVDAWPEDEVGRLELSFALDAVTRVLRFGGYARELEDRRPTPFGPQAASTAGTVRLAATPVGFSGELYARDVDGGLVSLSEGVFRASASITFSALRGPARRHASGFVDSENSWPRVSVRGIDLGVVIAGLFWSETCAVALSGSTIGQVEYSGGGSDGPGDSARLRSARIEAEVAEEGVRMSVHAEPDGRPALDLRLVLPWEVVVLRTDQLRRAHQRFVDADAVRRGVGG